MSKIVNIIWVEQGNQYQSMTKQVVKTLEFDDEDKAYEFEKNFGRNFFYDGTESHYVAEVAPVVSGTSAELIFTISISYGAYVLDRELVTNIQIEANPAMAQACKNYNSAYALNRKGEVIELEDGNVGVLTFYTLNHDLVQQLNDAR